MRYPVNLAMSIRKSLRPLPVAVCATAGLFLVLMSRKAKGMIVLLLSGVLFLLLMGLNHFEPRYYLFVTALYAGFAALTIRAIVAWVAERMSFTKAGLEGAFASALFLIGAPLVLASVRQLQRSYAEEPREDLRCLRLSPPAWDRQRTDSVPEAASGVRLRSEGRLLAEPRFRGCNGTVDPGQRKHLSRHWITGDPKSSGVGKLDRSQSNTRMAPIGLV